MSAHDPLANGDARRLRRVIASGLIAGALAAVAAVPVAAQYLREAKLAEAKALAGSALTALQGCAQGKGAGATCTLSEVAGRIGVDPRSGATGDGRWIVSPASAITLTAGAPAMPSGVVTVSGVAARDTDNTALALYATPGGRVVRCDTTSRVPPSISGGQAC
jgi:type II secretory pathway pseudopilin PulG